MSCEQSTKAYEAARDKFWELLEDTDFRCMVYGDLLDSGEQWNEKELGFHEDPYNRVFEALWKWDCELMFHDPNECIKKYIEIYGNFAGRNNRAISWR